jgi:phosphoenolpyruvate synthase/pyruvate phosphate dikinase
MHATQSIATKSVYDFSEGSRELRELLGGKGAGIAEMTRVLGPERVPAGFTITTAACVDYMRAGRTDPAGLAEQVDEALGRLEEQVGKRLGLDYVSCSPFRLPIARVAAAQAAIASPRIDAGEAV